MARSASQRRARLLRPKESVEAVTTLRRLTTCKALRLAAPRLAANAYATEAAGSPAAGAGVEELHQLVGVQVQQLVQVHATERELQRPAVRFASQRHARARALRKLRAFFGSSAPASAMASRKRRRID